MSKRLLPLLLLPWVVALQAGENATVRTDPTQDRVMMSAGFLSGHPDLRFRLWAMEAREDGRMDEAFNLFRRAAFYGDKPSQGMVAEMYWTGEGVAKDPALGYVWMDLAAERGYPGFLGLRERYWNALSEPDRARAIEEGQALYAKYGDAATEPRIAAQLRRARSQTTGSRTGFVGNLTIYIPGPTGIAQPIDGSKFYDPRYWDPKLYRQWQDAIWKDPKVGRVQVGEVEQVGSRVPPTAPNIDAPEPASTEPPPGAPPQP